MFIILDNRCTISEFTFLMTIDQVLPEIIFFFSQRRPNYFWWWLIYQGFFIVATAGIVIVFIRIRDDNSGLLSYLKNYLLRYLIMIFIAVFLSFIFLLIYFWLNVLSLYSQLRKEIQKKILAESNENRENLSEEIKFQNFTSSATTIQMIPLNLHGVENGQNSVKRNGKYFVVHV